MITKLLINSRKNRRTPLQSCLLTASLTTACLFLTTKSTCRLLSRHLNDQWKTSPPFAGDKPLTIGQASKALEQFRENVIKAEMDNWEPHRSILRDSMIETFISQHLSDPGEWFQKVP